MEGRLRLRLLLALALVLVLGVLPSVAAAEEMAPTTPTGEETMMMDEMMMNREMMLAEINTWIAALPLGIKVMIVDMLHHLPEETLMLVHYEMHHTDLLQQPPGIVYLRVHEIMSQHVH